MKKPVLLFFICCSFFLQYSKAQNIGINATGALPDTKAMLDVSSTTSGMLIPRMSSAERNAIATPPNGLEVYNTTTNNLDIYRGSGWIPVAYADTSVILVRSLADLPAPVSAGITLDSTKTYSFSGLVNIAPNYINVNGAALKGTNPIRDGVMSTVSGAILRSTNMHVYMEKLLVVNLTAATKAYDFSDNTGTRSCNIITGNNVKQTTASAGVGQVSGFRAVVILQNYFDVSDGIKVTGTMGRFISGFNLYGSITGTAIEFLPALAVDDIDISNNHFIYTGATGVKFNVGATLNRGRMTSNMIRGVTTPLSGFDSYTPAWEMQQNSGITNSRAFATAYMNDNVSVTNLPANGTYYSLAGTATLVNAKRFTLAGNKLTYTGLRPWPIRVFAVIGGKSPAALADYSICIAKNGTSIPFPNSSLGAMANGQGFQITLQSDVDMVTGDYIEIGVKRNNNNTSNITITDLQFSVSSL
ncbi:MAG: hypothetical protein JWQ27_1724 [Ferruginibacter sp.]|nr:hypothetical protein [Ferruginibacter sp.]